MGGLAVVAALALIFGLAGATILHSSQLLASDIAAAFRSGLQPATVPSSTETGLNLVIIDGPPTGALAAIQILVIGVLFGGLPVAIIGVLLARHHGPEHASWSSGWSQVFLGCFVFQLANLCLTSLLLTGLATAAGELPSALNWSDAWLAGGLILSITGSAVALRSWRALMAATATDTLRIRI